MVCLTDSRVSGAVRWIPLSSGTHRAATRIADLQAGPEEPDGPLPVLGPRIPVERGTHSSRVEVPSQFLHRRRGDPVVVFRKVTEDLRQLHAPVAHRSGDHGKSGAGSAVGRGWTRLAQPARTEMTGDPAKRPPAGRS